MLHDLNLHLIEQAAQATARSRANPFHAEIVPGCTPNWHILVCQANNEQIAAGHLIGRGFGTYLPQFQHKVISRGRKAWRSVNIFPGYVFLFVWDIRSHWRRIKGCTGVAGALQTIEGTPLVVSDAMMDEIQAIEFKQLVGDGGLKVQEATGSARKRRKKRRLEAWLAEASSKDDDNRMTISTKSYWEKIGELDDSGRNSLLHRALGLGSQVAPSSSVLTGPASPNGR